MRILLIPLFSQIVSKKLQDTLFRLVFFNYSLFLLTYFSIIPPVIILPKLQLHNKEGKDERREGKEKKERKSWKRRGKYRERQNVTLKNEFHTLITSHRFFFFRFILKLNIIQKI